MCVFFFGITCAKIHITLIIVNAKQAIQAIQSTSTPRLFNYMHFLFVTIFMDANLFLPSADVNVTLRISCITNRMSKVNDMLSQGIMSARAMLNRTKQTERE